MMQPSLFDLAPEPPATDGLVCAFGEPWMGAHPLCEAEADRMCALFDASVAAGEYDARGHKLRTTKGRR
jgi:hypothetical protein